HEPHAVAQPRLRRLDNRVGLAAVRALVVAVLDQRHRRVGGALDVVALGVDRNGERRLPARRGHVASSFCRSSSAARIPSAPGLTLLGETKLQLTTPSPSSTNSARRLVPASSL